MEINMTVVIQAVQFMIAYYFLYNYLFVPAYNILIAEEQKEKELQDDIASHQKEVAELQHKKNRRFGFLKNKLFQFVPQLRSDQIVINKKFTTENKQEFDAEVGKAQEFLVNKLSDVQK